MDSIKDTVNSVSSSIQNSGTSEGQEASVSETVSKGVEYLQEKATGQNPKAEGDQANNSANSGPSAADVREANPEKIQDFIRDKYKSDPNDFPDVQKGND